MEILHTPGEKNYRCHECDTWVDRVIVVGEPPDAESSTANLCASCVQRAALMMATHTVMFKP